MVNFTKKLFITMSFIILFCTTNVHAYVNGELYENLIFPNRGQFISFNGNTGTDLGTAYQIDSTDVHTDNERRYYYLSDPSLYNDSSGTAFRFTTPVTIVENEIIDLSVVFCSDIQNAWYGNGVPTVMVGYNAQTLNGALYHAPTTSGWDVLTYLYETDATTFIRCNIFKVSFTSRGVGQYVSVRFKTSGTVPMGRLSFMGYQFSKNGIDYTGYFNSLGNSIDNVGNQQEQTNEKLDNIDNTIKDNNVDNPNFEEFEEYIAENGVITQLITLPVRLYTQILNNINSTCTPFSLGELFGHNLTMDCINPSDFFGNVLWNTIDILGSGLFIYAISKKMISVFHQFTNLEEGDILD